MKKIIPLMILLLMAISFIGCGKPPSSEKTDSIQSKKPSTVSSPKKVSDFKETVMLKEETIKLMNAKKFDEALKVIDKAIDIDHRDDLITKKADIYISMKRYSDAEKELKDALKVSERIDRKAHIYGELADVYNATAQDDKALEAAREFEKLEPELPKNAFKELPIVYGVTGTILADAREYDKAINYFNKALEKEPGERRLLFERGYAYYQTGDKEKAMADIQEWMKDPLTGKKDKPRTMGNAYMIMGEYDKALKYFNKAMEANPKNFSYYNDRAYVYILQGNKKAAIKDLNLVIEKYPADNWEVKMANSLLEKTK